MKYILILLVFIIISSCDQLDSIYNHSNCIVLDKIEQVSFNKYYFLLREKVPV